MRYIHSEEILEVPENGTCCSIAAILTSSFPARETKQRPTTDSLGKLSSEGFRQVEGRLLTLFATA
jgi:hypothetical protein